MTEVAIKTRSDGKTYTAETSNMALKPGDDVLVETEQCQEVGQVADDSKVVGETRERVVLIRRLMEKDYAIDEEKKKEATQNIDRCREIISKHDLPMEILTADLSYDGKKLTFYFSAPGRIDFRALVSELASNFQKLIRLQQVGSRDRAKCAGGIGRCGRDFCCRSFLKGELDCVSTDMSYDQNLGQMGSNRVTGACGKLMCCLKYELDFYQKAKAKLPRIGEEVATAKGKGRVISQSVLKGKVTVELEDRVRLEVDC